MVNGLHRIATLMLTDMLLLSDQTAEQLARKRQF
jgi:hypothetical protein